MSRQSETHYHICWNDLFLDWEAFRTKEEAMSLANVIKKPNEHFTVVERVETCERCRAFQLHAQKSWIKDRPSQLL